MEKVVQLQRGEREGENPGSFGFSVFGGAGARLPAAVCEVTPGGPADQSGQMQVGDILKEVNGELLDDKTPSEVVQAIRSAPVVTTFILVEDEVVREKTRSYLRKQNKRKKRQSSSSSPGSRDDTPSKAAGSLVEGDGERHRSVPPNEPHPKHSTLNRVSPSAVAIRPQRLYKSKSSSDINPDPSPTATNSLGGHSSVQRNLSHREFRFQNQNIFGLEELTTKGDSPKPTTKWQISSIKRSSPSSAKPVNQVNHYGQTEEDGVELDGTESECALRGDSATPVLESKLEDDSISFRSDSDATVRGDSATPKAWEEREGHVIVGEEGWGIEEEQGTEERNDCKGGHDREGHGTVEGSGAGDAGLSIEEGNGTEEVCVTEGVCATDKQSNTEEEQQSTEAGSSTAEGERHDTEGEECDAEEDGSSGVLREEDSRSEAGSKEDYSSSMEESIKSMEPVKEADKKMSVASLGHIVVELTEDTPPQPVPQFMLGAIEEAGEDMVSSQDSTHISRTERFLTPMNNSLVKQRCNSEGAFLDEGRAASDLADKLFYLDGFEKSVVAKHLSMRSDFGTTVAQKYLKHFSFRGLGLDGALRNFCGTFALVGESQEIERIMQHFADRYQEENPTVFPDSSTVYGVVCAALLLNSDLHIDHAGKKMSSSKFIENVLQLEITLPDNKKEFHKVLKSVYESIKAKPLEFSSDERPEVSPVSSPDEGQGSVRIYRVVIPGSFVEVDLPADAPVFKEGNVMRKNIMEGPHKKVPRGHRGWRAYYAYLKGFMLYFTEPNSELRLGDTEHALPVMNCLAARAHDYSKKNAVLRITTSDWKVILLQTTNMLEVQQWITAVNQASATYSSAPLATAVGSQTKFVRPMYPMKPASNDIETQVAKHEETVRSLEKELEEHREHKPKSGRSGRTADWFDKLEFLQYEINRYRIYQYSLSADVDVELLNAPLPSGMVPSPSIQTLATATADYPYSRYHGPPSPTPSTNSGYKESPLMQRRGLDRKFRT